ncbi:MAG: CBS domain-containing protein [Planctomycetota bacterium]|jgi:hypothetical protein
MAWTSTSKATIRRFFKSGFTAGDVAEALVSFDADRNAGDLRGFMEMRDFDAIGVRQDGHVAGFVLLDDLGDGACSQAMRPFDQAIVMDEETPLHLVIPALEELPRVFITALGVVGGIITRSDIEKPTARMWLFGLVTLIEMAFSELISTHFPDESWREIISPSRLEKALALQKERQRRRRETDLLSCLQFADKGEILFQDIDVRGQFQFESRTAAKHMLSQIERMRNALAHSNPVVPDNWEIITRFSARVDGLLSLLDTRDNR